MEQGPPWRNNRRGGIFFLFSFIYRRVVWGPLLLHAGIVGTWGHACVKYRVKIFGVYERMFFFFFFKFGG